MALSPSTIAPSAIHLDQPFDQLEYQNVYVAPDDIDSILASACNPEPTPQDRQHYPQAAANLDAFNQELLPLQALQIQRVEPRLRQDNEPWVLFNATSLQPMRGRRLSDMDSFGHAGRIAMQGGLNPQKFNGINKAIGKAYSECGYTLGDSGYGTSYGVISPATQSMASRGDHGTHSVFSGDLNNQTQESLSIASGLDHVDFQSQSTEPLPYDPFADGQPQQTTLNSTSDINQAVAPMRTTMEAGPPWNCTECEISPFKNKSEHKSVSSVLDPFPSTNPALIRKHMLRHKKPFKCNRDECSLKGLGFGTRNDLDRHRKSVHKIAPGTSTDKTFRCSASGCRNKDKIWPRADNFRHHCARQHQDIDTECLMRQSYVSSEAAMFKGWLHSDVRS